MGAQAANLLEMIPVLKGEWERAEGIMAIKAPRFKSTLGRRLSRLIGVNPDFYVRLRDPLALAVLELIDGQRSVGEIAETWKMRFPKEIQPQERLIDFLKVFERNHWIEYQGK